jgi:hypothetical protein
MLLFTFTVQPQIFDQKRNKYEIRVDLAASIRAVLITLSGSMIPALIMSTYSPTLEDQFA